MMHNEKLEKLNSEIKKQNNVEPGFTKEVHELVHSDKKLVENSLDFDKIKKKAEKRSKKGKAIVFEDSTRLTSLKI